MNARNARHRTAPILPMCRSRFVRLGLQQCSTPPPDTPSSGVYLAASPGMAGRFRVRRDRGSRDRRMRSRCSLGSARDRYTMRPVSWPIQILWSRSMSSARTLSVPCAGCTAICSVPPSGERRTSPHEVPIHRVPSWSSASVRSVRRGRDVKAGPASLVRMWPGQSLGRAKTVLHPCPPKAVRGDLHTER